MMYKAFLFDLDDTLLKASTVKWAQHKAVARQFYNIDLTDKVLAKHWGMPLEPMMAIFYENSDTAENMLKAYLSLADQFPKVVHDNAVDVVEALLNAGIKVGVVTSTLGHLARKDLARLRFPVEKFFLVQGSDDVPVHKPDPRIFDQALILVHAGGITPQETVYVGDAFMDYYAARDAGIGFIGVTTGFVTREQFEAQGAQTISTLPELRELIKDTSTNALR